MAKKLKVYNDSPVTVCFALLALVAFALDTFVLKGKLLASVLTCPGGKLSSPSFNFSSAADYIKLLLHVFGFSSWNAVFINCLFVLMLGPELEERYGSPVLALMLAVSALVTGVLNACLSPAPVFGASCVVFTMIFLTGMTDLAKKHIRISWIFIFVFYIIYQFYSVYSGNDVRLSLTANKGFLLFLKKNAVTFISLAGGICGSLFGFLVSPKKRSAPRKNFDDTELESDSSSAPEKSSFFGKKHSLLKKAEKARKSSSNDETVIGTISL